MYWVSVVTDPKQRTFSEAFSNTQQWLVGVGRLALQLTPA